jgi:hypothetical protein
MLNSKLCPQKTLGMPTKAQFRCACSGHTHLKSYNTRDLLLPSWNLLRATAAARAIIPDSLPRESSLLSLPSRSPESSAGSRACHGRSCPVVGINRDLSIIASHYVPIVNGPSCPTPAAVPEQRFSGLKLPLNLSMSCSAPPHARCLTNFVHGMPPPPHRVI